MFSYTRVRKSTDDGSDPFSWFFDDFILYFQIFVLQVGMGGEEEEEEGSEYMRHSFSGPKYFTFYYIFQRVTV